MLFWELAYIFSLVWETVQVLGNTQKWMTREEDVTADRLLLSHSIIYRVFTNFWTPPNVNATISSPELMKN